MDIWGDHSREDLCNRHVIRLGELHIVFAIFRAIETYIEGSGIDQSWVKPGWFSKNTMQQVFSCSCMKRALPAHENMLVAIYILYLNDLITESNESLSNQENMKAIIKALGSSGFEDIKVAIAILKNTLCDKNVVEKLERFESRKNNNHFSVFNEVQKHGNNIIRIYKCFPIKKLLSASRYT